MDALFVPLAAAVGASVDQIKLITCLLVAYPLGSLFIRIPSSRPELKHLFSLGVTLIFFFPVLHLQSAFFQLLGSVLGTYFIAQNVKGANMPWIVFAFAMGHLTINHIIRAWFSLSYETMEVTGPQMVLTMKLTTFAWNVYDGRRKAEDLDKWQLEKRIVKFPSILEFLGYSFYFPGILVGPYLDYAEYTALINESLFKGAEGKTKPGRAVPTGRKRVAYVKMVKGLAYLGAFVVLGGSYNFGVALQSWFSAKSLMYRIAYFQLCGFIERSKYYAIWTLTEGASILTGLGFTGFNASGASTWDGAANVIVLQIEFPQNFKMLLDSWNMKTNVWLRECVYKRVTPKGKKPGFKSSLITFGTSAFWHGIAGGYYLTFFLGAFITTAARLARSTIRPLLLPAPNTPPSLAKRLYDLGGTVLSVLLVNYAATPFMLLSIKDSFTAWQALGWYGFYIIFVPLAFFYAGGSGWLKSMHQGVKVEKKKEVKVEDSGNESSASESFATPPSFDRVIPPPKFT